MIFVIVVYSLLRGISYMYFFNCSGFRKWMGVCGIVGDFIVLLFFERLIKIRIEN